LNNNKNSSFKKAGTSTYHAKIKPTPELQQPRMFNVYSIWSSATTTSDLSGSTENAGSSSLARTNEEQALPGTYYPPHPANNSTWSEPPINQPNVNQELSEVDMRDEDEDDLYADARGQAPSNEDANMAMSVDVNFTGWSNNQDFTPQAEAGLMVSTIIREDDIN
jgi:hypothetical protein